MKTIKNFAGQQLTKSQMNNIKGGTWYMCSADGQYVGFVNAGSQKEAEKVTQDTYPGDKVSCTKYE